MRKRTTASRRRTAPPTPRPETPRHSATPLVLYTIGLLAAALLIRWVATRGRDAPAPVRLAAAEGVAMTVYMPPTCQCCGRWVTHMRKAGFAVTVVHRHDLPAVRAEHGVPRGLAACHTTTVRAGDAEYSLEGHVPAADIVRLLRERPRVRGIAAPGMPAGSPGMEGGIRTPFDVVSFDASGNRAVYARH